MQFALRLLFLLQGIVANEFRIAICTITNRNVGADAHVGPPLREIFLKSGPM